MDTIRVDILNPKAKNLLKSLADLDLIAIRDVSENGLAKLLKKLRSKEAGKPSLEEIAKEVEQVRSKRYGKSSK